MMRSKSLNVTATSLISSFSREIQKRAQSKIERERGRVIREGIKRDREERKREKNRKFSFSATAIEIESSREYVQLKEIENIKELGNRKFNRFF